MAEKRNNDTILVFLAAHRILPRLLREYFSADPSDYLRTTRARFDVAHTLDYIYSIRARTDALPYVTTDEILAVLGWQRKSLSSVMSTLDKLGYIQKLDAGRFRRVKYQPTIKLQLALRHIRKAIAVEVAQRHKKTRKNRT